MANLLDKLIQDLLDSNGGEETPTVVALRAKRDELGDDVSEQEARDAALSVLMQFMPTDGSDDAGSSSSSSSAGTSVVLDSLYERSQSMRRDHLGSKPTRRSSTICV